MNLILKAGLIIERKKESREAEKQQIVKGKYLNNFASLYGFHRRVFESDAKFRERIQQEILKGGNTKGKKYCFKQTGRITGNW